MNAHWEGDIKEEFKSTLNIFCIDRAGLLADVTLQLSGMHILINSLNSRVLKNGRDALITATITVSGLEHLNSVIERLSKIKGVVSIERS